jgi:dinuclear metal center YbgI/SA1388 family protein
MILKELATVFDTIFYKNLALDWDKTGLRVGNIQKDIRKILITLDLTDSVIQEAVRAKVDLLLSHHPLLMEPIDSFLDTNSLGSKLLEIIKNSMAVYTAHTNYDIMPEGLNLIFAKKLGLAGIKSAYLEPACASKAHPYEENKFVEGGLGIIGELDVPVKLPVFFKKVKESLAISGFRWIASKMPGEFQRESATVKKILVINGSANSFTQRIAVSDFDCDVVIVGELNYHSALEITESGKIIIEIGHGDSEKFAVEGMYDILNKYFKENDIKDIEVIKSKEGYKSWRYYIG